MHGDRLTVEKNRGDRALDDFYFLLFFFFLMLFSLGWEKLNLLSQDLTLVVLIFNDV